MINIKKLKIGQRVYNKNASVCEYGVVQNITPKGSVRVLYDDGKSRLHAPEALSLRRLSAIRKPKKEKETEDTALLNKLETLPDKEQKDIRKAATYTGCSLKEVMKVKGIIP
jgi:DNA-directed RNA polymerase specialized sigma subunit